MAAAGIARAQPGDAPTPVDAARQNERYAIPPGAEPLFADLLGSGQTLPKGCTFSGGQIQRTSVVATYTCGSGQVALQLLHPEIAPSGGVRTRRFAVTVKSGAPPDGFIDALAERIRAREAAFEWVTLERPGTQKRSRAVPVAAAAAVAIFVFWTLRRRAARRRRRN